MERSEHELTPTDQHLDAEQQKAVLMLAARLQTEIDEGATLADMILSAQEVGISREAVERAYQIVVTQKSEPALRKELERKLTHEMGGIYLSLLWAAATWIGVLFLPILEIFGMIGVGGTFLVYPALIGILVRRPWIAAALTTGVMMNLLIAFSVKFGMPREAGAQANLVIFAVPIIMSAIVSACANRLAELQIHRKPKA